MLGKGILSKDLKETRGPAVATRASEAEGIARAEAPRWEHAWAVW